MKMSRLSALPILLASATALAQFEGVVEMKMTSPQGAGGNAKAFVSKAATRTELEMQVGKGQAAGMPAGMKMVMLMKLANPDVVYSINDAQKTYAVIDTKKMRDQMPGKEKEPKYSVKKIGSDTVAGYACEKVLITSDQPKSMETEACVAKEAFGGSSWYQSMMRNQQGGAGTWKAMKDAGIEGFPVRTVMREKGKPEVLATMEVVKIEKKALPSSLFEIPAGYKETSMMGSISPEAAKQMEEAMKNMTPEQRKQIEEMMKKRGQ